MNTSGVIKHRISLPRRRLAIRLAIFIVAISCATAALSAAKNHAQEYILSQLQTQALQHGAFLQANSLALNFFTSSPAATLSGLSLSHGSYDSHLSNAQVHLSTRWGKILTGKVIPELVTLSDAEFTVNLSDNQSVQSTSASNQSLTARDVFKLLTQPLALPEAHIKLQDIVVFLTHEDQQTIGNINLNGYIDSNSLLSTARLELDGKVADEQLSSTAIIEMPNNTPLQNGSTLNIDSRFAGGSLTTALAVVQSDDQSPATVSIKTTGTGLLKVLETIGGPAIDNIDLNATVSVEEETLIADGITLSMGETKISADLEVSAASDKPQIALSIASDSIPLDELLPGPNQATAHKSDSTPVATHLLSRSPPALYQWVNQWDIKSLINISSLKYLGYEMNDLTVQASVENSNALLAINSSQFGSGTLESRAQYKINPDSPPSGFVTLSIQNMNLEKFSIEPDVNNIITAGTLTTETELWFEGLSSADLAASLDGDLYVLLENGTVDSMAVELAGADIMESLRLLFKRELQQVDVKCGYANVHFSSGHGDVEHFLIDSDDTLFSASGSVDLNNEKLNLTLTPIPHDASLLTATTPIHIKGTFANPKFRPGKKLYTRIAAAAVLISLTGPAAALLPFIGIGDGGESSSCTDLFTPQ